jgi:hypothetical protein
VTPLPLGKCVATPGAIEAMREAGVDPASLLRRHESGEDWGDLDAHDKAANDEALTDGSRILSAYILPTGAKLWVITEGTDDSGVRESTCILLPSEY